jgi:hypothetical protein
VDPSIEARLDSLEAPVQRLLERVESVEQRVGARPPAPPPEPAARPTPAEPPRGYRPPYRLLYGNTALRARAYDFQQVPRRELRPVRAGRLAPERANEAFEPPEDTRSFAERHDWVVEAALAFAAAVIGVGGFLALRRRA